MKVGDTLRHIDGSFRVIEEFIPNPTPGHLVMGWVRTSPVGQDGKTVDCNSSVGSSTLPPDSISPDNPDPISSL